LEEEMAHTLEQVVIELATATEDELHNALEGAAEDGTTAETHEARQDAGRWYNLIEAIGRFRFPDTFDHRYDVAA
jgi:hypothetical protein